MCVSDRAFELSSYRVTVTAPRLRPLPSIAGYRMCVCGGGGARSPSLAHSHTHKQMHPISKDTTDINSSTDETEIKKNNKKHSHGKPGDHSFSWGCLKNGRGCR